MATTRAVSSRGASVLVPVLLILLGGGCQYRLSFFTPPRAAVSPVGTEASIRVREGGRDRTIMGELIEVREDGLLLLAYGTSELTLLPYGVLVAMDFENAPGVSTSVGGTSDLFRSTPPLEEDEERQRALAAFSRYPFGLDDTLLQRLIESLGQSGLVVVGP